MRLWSIHPRYLDSRGLVALWREALLAQAVLAGRTKGYRNHPQLERFRASGEPLRSIRSYLEEILSESRRRGYAFDPGRIDRRGGPGSSSGKRITVGQGQLVYELSLLRSKLAFRDPESLERTAQVSTPDPHPLFEPIEGPIEPWERPKEVLRGLRPAGGIG